MHLTIHLTNKQENLNSSITFCKLNEQINTKTKIKKYTTTR